MCYGWLAVRFSALFEPPTPESCSSRPRTQTDGSPHGPHPGICVYWYRNCQPHYISAILDSRPTYMMSPTPSRICQERAFNYLSMEAFMPLIRTHLPDILPCGLTPCVREHHTHHFLGELSHLELPSTYNKNNSRPKRYKAWLSLRGSALCLRATPPLVLPCALYRAEWVCIILS